MNEESSKEIRR